MRTVILLANGPETKWDSEEHGHRLLQDIEGTPLLERTAMQLIDREIRPLVATWDGKLGMSCRLWQWMCLPKVSSQASSTKEALRRHFDQTSDPCVILSGDVIFSADAIDTILERGHELHVFGRKTHSRLTGGALEQFAVSCPLDKRGSLLAACEASMQDWEEERKKRKAGGSTDRQVDAFGCPYGTMWQAYRSLIGKDLHALVFDHQIWVNIDDWTEDVDQPHELQKYLRRFARRWVGDTG